MRQFHAPGRVNLIGDHIDYMGGTVLPMAIDRGTDLWVGARSDRRIVAVSDNFSELGEVVADMDAQQARPEWEWVNYLVGVAYAFQARGVELPGVDVRVRGNIPNGAGLSSSASLELAMAVAFDAVADVGSTAAELALVGQSAENDFIGVACGIMDQLSIATGVAGHALRIDCGTLAVSPVRFPSEIAVVVANTNQRRELSGSAYNQRRSACETAQEILGVRLVDVPPDDVEAAVRDLPEDLRPRARHVITEQARVWWFADALERADLSAAGDLMRASHESLRDDFEVTGPALDALVEAAWRGARCHRRAHDRCRIRWLHGEPGPSGCGRRVHAACRRCLPPQHRATCGLLRGEQRRWCAGGDVVIEPALGRLLEHARRTGLIASDDVAYARNRVLEVLGIEDYDLTAEGREDLGGPLVGAASDIDDLLRPLLDDAAVRGLITPDTVTQRDLWDSAIMGCFVQRPSSVARHFWDAYAGGPAAATDWYHQQAVASNYIRVSRTDRNTSWRQPTVYGEMDMTINVSKPEKDPRDIIAEAREHAAGYPQCLLCPQNEGYAGRADHPARQNLRLIPMDLVGERWYSAVLAVPLLQRALHRAQRRAPADAHRPQHVRTVGRVHGDVPALSDRLQRGPADRGRFDPQPRPLPGRPLRVPDGSGTKAMDPAARRSRDQRPALAACGHRLSGPDDAVIGLATDILAAWREYSDPTFGIQAVSHGVPTTRSPHRPANGRPPAAGPRPAQQPDNVDAS